MQGRYCLRNRNRGKAKGLLPSESCDKTTRFLQKLPIPSKKLTCYDCKRIVLRLRLYSVMIPNI